jgi:hypothetical protein
MMQSLGPEAAGSRVIMRKIMMGTAAIALTASLGTGTAVIAAGTAEAATTAKVLAKKDGVTLPAGPNAEQRATVAKLKTFSVTRFNLNWTPTISLAIG